MSDKVLVKKNDVFDIKNVLTVHGMVKIALLSVLAYVIMLIEVPVMFFPSFLKIDLSDVPALIAGFAIGPAGGVMVELVKNLLHLITKTDTGGVGELANFLVGVSLILPASISYKISRTKKSAYLGMISGIVLMAVAGGLANYYILIPFYSRIMPLEQIIQISAAANSLIKDVKTLILYGVVPFNILKGIIVILFTRAIYKKISYLLTKRAL